MLKFRSGTSVQFTEVATGLKHGIFNLIHKLKDNFLILGVSKRKTANNSQSTGEHQKKKIESQSSFSKRSVLLYKNKVICKTDIQTYAQPV